MARGSILITGGISGIGLPCARKLAREGWHVLIASRDVAASDAAVRGIVEERGVGAAEALALDLGSTDSVRELAAEIERRDVPLSGLVCNAGLQFMSGPHRNADGHELTFAVNHLGHFLLANLLLDRLVAHAPARIVVVSSGVHDPSQKTGMPKPDVRELDVLASTGCGSKEGYDGRLAYVNSKLCNLWFAYELDRRLERAGLAGEPRTITVIAWEPGLVPASGLARDYAPPLRFLWNYVLPGIARVVNPVLPSISWRKRSGEALADTVLDPALDGQPVRYYPSHSRWAAAPSSDDSYDEARQGELWEASVRLAGLRTGDSPLAG